MGALDALAPLERKIDAPLRIPVTDIFRNERGVPTIMGKVQAGVVTVGQNCFIMPGKLPVEILAIESDAIAKMKSAK